MILPSLLSGLVIVICILNIITKSNTQSPGDIRLVGLSSSAGRVEIYYRGVWGTVCDDYWDMKEGAVVCRQLGYSAAVAVYSNAHFGRGSGNIWMDDIRCNGTELRLSDCSYNGWGVHDCSHSEDAGVACQNYTRKTLSGGGSCSFESGPGLCGYTNTHDDKFDWTLHSGSTLSSNTGPPYDHTTGYGHYIYIESSYPRRQGDRARLLSPQITGGKCLEFYHHMKGSHIGELNVYVEYGNNKTMLWQRVGEQSHIWMLAKIPIYGLSTFKILFEGVVGSGYEGDIALDDIQILNETCIPDNSGNCTFDNGNLCGYKNAKDDDGGFDWVLHTGVNPNFNGSYGPQQDHTTGTGNFVQITPYVDRWWHRKEGKEARLVSPEIFGAKCVQFYYHMKGRGSGKLNVLIDNGKSKIMVWQLSGDQSSTWSKGMLPVKGLRTFKIIFEGVAGTNYKANIAVDDIKVFNNTCASFPSSSTNFTSISNHFRVVGGVSQSEGIIKIKYRGTWGTICNDGWDVNNAKVVCRQMGYSKVVSLKLGYAVSPSFGIINPIIRLQCKGTESSISLCAYEPVVSAANNCNQAAQVICENQNVRLVGGKTRNEGIVQVFYRFRWGTICNRGNWDMNDAKVVCRQLGYSKVVSLKLGYHAASYHSDPIIRKLKCKGNESFVRLCAFESLLSIGSQNCNHSHDSQVVCSNPVPPPSKACHPRCPRCQKTVKYGDICVCSLKNTDAIYQWCDASIGLDVMKVLLLNLSMDQWNAVKFKTSLADQLNIYCKNIKCGSQSKFDANDVIVLDNYPKVSNGQDIVLQFIVLDLNSKRPIPQDVLYSMFKINHNLAGYLVKLPDRHVKTISHTRTGISSKHLKLVIAIVVVVVIGIALALFVVFKKRKNGKFSLAVGYHGSNSNECLTTKMQT